MRWDESHQSPNLEDRRGDRPQGAGFGGGGWLLFSLFSRFGWKGLLIGGAILGLFYGVQSFQTKEPAQRPAAENTLVKFTGFVFDDVQSYWAQARPGYTPAKVVVYTGSTPTRCGYGSAAVGPFYCPLDQKVYLDMSFYRQMREQLGAPGDFAQAYVIAHEVGHHVQNLAGKLGTKGSEGKASSVATELQADCLAGVWAHSAEKRGLLEVGDLDEALGAAAAVGDDTLQRKQSGTVRPESFTHGSAAQRKAAVSRGYRTGDPAACVF
jgi:uncharacterized protein